MMLYYFPFDYILALKDVLGGNGFVCVCFGTEGWEIRIKWVNEETMMLLLQENEEQSLQK